MATDNLKDDSTRNPGFGRGFFAFAGGIRAIDQNN